MVDRRADYAGVMMGCFGASVMVGRRADNSGGEFPEDAVYVAGSAPVRVNSFRLSMP